MEEAKGEGEITATVVTKGELVVIDRAKLPNMAELILDHKWSEGAKFFIKAKNNPYEETREEISRALFEMASHCQDMGLSNEEMYVTLSTKAAVWGIPFDDEENELTEVISLVRQKTSGGQLARLIDPMNSAESRTKLYNFGELLTAEFKVEWVMPGLLTEQGVLAVSGPPGVGKTQLTIRLCIALATGTEFLGYKIGNGIPRKILFMSLEMIESELQQFISAMAEELTEEQRKLLDENFIFYPAGSALYLNANDDRAEYWRIIQEVQPDGVVIDSWSQAVMGNLSDDTITRDSFAFVNAVRKHAGCFFIIINHTKKAQGDNVPNTQDGIFGSRFFTASVSMALVVWPHKESANQIELHFVKNRFAERPGKPLVVTRTKNLNFVITGENVVASLIPGQKAKKKRQVIDDLIGLGEGFVAVMPPEPGIEMPKAFNEALLKEETSKTKSPLPGFEL